MSAEPSRRLMERGEAREAAISRITSQDAHDESTHSFASYEDDLPELLVNVDDDCLIEEATVMDAKEITIETPIVPEKSALRRARLLRNLTIDTTAKPRTDPHDVYLSSEEDASSSADDFSDYDSDSDESDDAPARRKSQEDTARAVSVVFVGRPCVVDLTSGRRSASPVRTPRARSSSPALRSDSLSSRSSRPPREGSPFSTQEMPRESPAFLTQDPFAGESYSKPEPPFKTTAPGGRGGGSAAHARAPMLPFRRFRGSLSLARKRSRPNLKAAASRDSLLLDPAASASTSSLHALSSPSPPGGEEEEEPPRRKSMHRRPESAVASAFPDLPVTYHDIMASARRNAGAHLLTKRPTSPTTPKRGILSGLHMNRRRSLLLKP
ncbi:hypothetical protein GGS23DRAFT_547809 [Durotheca rogersii]|uniref:uncharacterized protein n=1 Tax=Durotheca rogersii TaxID=419775 RepID=UPI0022201A58|nr:uncharacterized protein GGS23DRAFT_547809 [Durotheca rogersii]KAI5867320.1 hypothetical protein GGS23DRAFT_547809 [Durotheca rogersii]